MKFITAIRPHLVTYSDLKTFRNILSLNQIHP